MIEEAIYTLVTTDTATKALIGTRFYPLTIPQDAALPACAYQVVSENQEYHHQGPCGWATKRLQITITAESYLGGVKAVAAAIKARLSGYKGTLGTVKIHSIFFMNAFDSDYVESGLVTVRQDYEINYQED